jgi:hypothetical protein
MHLGLFILGTGSHIAGWRYPGALTSFQSMPAVVEIGRSAERGHRTRCGSNRSRCSPRSR